MPNLSILIICMQSRNIGICMPNPSIAPLIVSEISAFLIIYEITAFIRTNSQTNMARSRIHILYGVGSFSFTALQTSSFLLPVSYFPTNPIYPFLRVTGITTLLS